ncbi:MAG: transcriptional regulator, GntR family with aminotransferase domain protein [Desulfomicrobiaceae bacterium]|jgi:DNA-binding transcriptional MocR family regulator|nr:transcriptional regulator, GntR family with aminotransferase domain protein [Desulfomicrobiaceae bacterium]
MRGCKYLELAEALVAARESRAGGVGERLPSVRTLRARYGVSINTVLAAYGELEARGLVEARPRSGYFWRLAPPSLPPRPPELELRPREMTKGALIARVLASVGSAHLVPLGINCPAPEFLPGRALGRIAGQLVRQQGADHVGYAPVEGLWALREQIAVRAAGAGCRVSPGEVLVTSGAMEALYVALRAVLRPGDTALIAAPSYFCFQQLLENLGVRAVEIPSSPEHGVRPQDVRRAVEQISIQACILTPNFNNPDGSLMPDAAKAEIVDFLTTRGIPLIEDDVAGDLHLAPRRPPLAKAFDRQGMVLTCSSFSKTLCPGYRIGWVLPGRWFAEALAVKATTNVSSATLPQMVVAAYLCQGRYDRHVRRLRSRIARSMEAMAAAVARHFPPGTRQTRPQGGGVVWIELPSSVDAVELFFRAREQGIGIAPGTIFSLHGQLDHFVRLNAAVPWTSQIEDAVAALGRLAACMAA